MLTLDDLKMIAPGAIFARGMAEDNPLGINMTNSDKLLRWVAVRGGGMPDWAIYCFGDTDSAGDGEFKPGVSEDEKWEHVRTNGGKVFFGDLIRRLVPCTDEAFEYYRR